MNKSKREEPNQINTTSDLFQTNQNKTNKQIQTKPNKSQSFQIVSSQIKPCQTEESTNREMQSNRKINREKQSNRRT
jgi:hypothetical protein